MEYGSSAVLDVGSCWVRCGWGGEDRPRRVFRDGVGRPRHSGISLPSGSKGHFIGKDMDPHVGLLDVSQPVDYGLVVNWTDMELLLDHVFSRELKADPEELNVLLTETPLNPKVNRAKTAELLFEHFQVQRIYLGNSCVLGLYASGRTTGLVCECGHSVSHWVPVVEGYAMPSGVARMGYGGREVEEHLKRLLAATGFTFGSLEEEERLRALKESLCCLGHSPAQTFQLPDGSSLRVPEELRNAPEALFEPALMGLSSFGLTQAAQLSLEQSSPEPELKRQLLHDVVLIGGSSAIPGFEERVSTDLANLGDARVMASPNRKYGAWVGGALIACLNTFQPLWVTRDEYVELGPTIVLKKCF